MSRFLLLHLLGKRLGRWLNAPRKAPKRAKKTVLPSLEHLEHRELPAVTPVPALVADINPGAGNSNPSNLVNVSGELFFAANNGVSVALWESNGTSAGTTLVLGNNGSAVFNPTNLTAVGGNLFFSANGQGANSGALDLWESNGTSAGTAPVLDNKSSLVLVPLSLTNVNGSLFFSALGQGTNSGTRDLWQATGPTGATTLLDNAGSLIVNPSNLANVNGNLFFSANGQGANSTGLDLWERNGTSVITSPLFDNKGSPVLNPANLTAVGSELFFAANGQAGHTAETDLWQSNGTSAGTAPLADNLNNPTVLNPANLTAVGNELFFAANGQAGHTAEVDLWQSNGMAAATLPLKDNLNNPTVINPANLTNVSGNLFFAANGQAGHTAESDLWVSTGMAAGTLPLADNLANPTVLNPQNLANVNGNLFFAANGQGANAGSLVLWESTGLPAGTAPVNTNANAAVTNPQNLTNVSGNLFFSSNAGTTGQELWATSTANLTVTVTPVGPLTITAGTAVTYTITVTNNGTTAISNVTLTDAIPTGGTSVTLAPVTGMNPDGFVVSGTMASATTVGAGNTDTFTVTVTAPSSLAQNAAFNNSATVSSPTNPATTNTATGAITTVSKLFVLISGASTATVGQPTGFNITVTNQGPSDAQNVTLVDVVPSYSSTGVLTATINPDNFTVSGTMATATSVKAGSSDAFTFVTSPLQFVPAGTPFNDTVSITTATKNTGTPTTATANSTVAVPLLDLKQIQALIPQTAQAFQRAQQTNDFLFATQTFTLFLDLFVLNIELQFFITDTATLTAATNLALTLAANPSTGITIPPA